ncbi:dimethylarginine dimethylaminohydrolase family protein [Paludifilum halophilum]|uniref:Amidinotransferase n=1 Tax=Paludifilum halophilum TaxID=1642702 RepID=A0A235BC92_9BACL|nr:arginine deiminase family protein [Paludifilum halophilum]OYD09185.1 hypothetical protein CHM34_04580 [Paludifilum halophilum]
MDPAILENMQPSIACWNEYDTLRHVVLCPPRYMKISRIINEVQEKYAEENIDTDLAEKQHRALINTLKPFGIDIILLEPHRRFSDQVFTRDIAFTLGSRLFLANMEEEIRREEEEILERWLTEQRIPHHRLSAGSIEGGDVLIDRDTIWVGDSGRTSHQAIDELRREMPQLKVVSLPFPPDYLHLDCIFNILSPTEALIYPEAFSAEDLKLLSTRYDLIEVSAEEQFTLGTNVLSIGNRTVLSLPVNPRVNQSMRQRDFTVIEVDLSEIIKSGGSFRCCTMPLVRS